VAVATGFEPLVLDADLNTLVAAEECQGDATQHGQILSAMILSHPALVFVEAILLTEYST